jgi:predicted nucleic acid-binding Zn ribbon protein
MGMKERMDNWQIVEKWPEIVGAQIAQHAKAAAVDTENLFVEVDNPVWQSQLFLMKEGIIKKLKKYNVHIKDIKFRIIT